MKKTTENNTTTTITATVKRTTVRDLADALEAFAFARSLETTTTKPERPWNNLRRENLGG